MEEKMNNSCAGSCGGCADKMQCGGGCSKMGMCGAMGGGKYFWLLKKVVRIAVLVLVFWFGTQLGEMRALMHYSHQSPRMMNVYGAGMMGGNTAFVAPQQ